MNPFVSLIIITKNNVKTIGECIDGILTQDYPRDNFEVIFVDGHSNDGTVEVIERNVLSNPFMRLVFEDKGTMGYARNVGIGVSRGEILAFTDGDAVIPKDWLLNVSKYFVSSEVSAVGGFDILVNSAESGRIVDSWRRMSKVKGVTAISRIKTVNFAIRRDTLISCGGFDSSLSHWDEAELLARIASLEKSASILYDPELIVLHKREQSTGAKKVLRRLFRKSLNGTGVLMRKHMVRLAFADPLSTVGISFFLIPTCLITFSAVLLSIALGFFVPLIVVGLILYGSVFFFYLVRLYQKTHQVGVQTFLSLSLDFFVRFFGTFLGFFKAAKEFMIRPK